MDIFLFLLFLLFQNITPPSPSGDSFFEKYALTIILLILTNGLQFLINRPKSESDIQKNFADTIKTYVQTIKEIQETNSNLYSKIQTLQEANRTQAEHSEEIDEALEKAQKELQDCLDRNGSCEECQEVLGKVLSIFRELETHLKEMSEAELLLSEIRLLSEKIAQTKKG